MNEKIIPNQKWRLQSDHNKIAIVISIPITEGGLSGNYITIEAPWSETGQMNKSVTVFRSQYEIVPDKETPEVEPWKHTPGTVGELKAAISNLPNDMPVLVATLGNVSHIERFGYEDAYMVLYPSDFMAAIGQKKENKDDSGK